MILLHTDGASVVVVEAATKVVLITSGTKVAAVVVT